MSSCLTQAEDAPMNGVPFDGTGYKPIYATDAELHDVGITSSEALRSPGKIYVLDRYLFVNEMGKGVHIIDNSDPKNPKNLSFISILGNHDIAAKGTWLYADNATDLLVFDISDPTSPKLSKRIADAIPVQKYPPFQNIYFECADDKKGTVVGWEKVTMATRPNCFR
jgi:hypothetical protein